MAAQKPSTSDPAPRYGVLSHADADGRVWHYPVTMEPEAVSPAASVAGQVWPIPIYFMRVARGGRGGQSRQPQTPIRFTSRLRAVRFTQMDAELTRETLRQMARLLAVSAVPTVSAFSAGPGVEAGESGDGAPQRAREGA